MAEHHKPQLRRFLAAETDTLALGAALAPYLRPGMVIYLSGEVGAGKTVLARGVLRALGAVGRIKSPTFTLVEPYVLSKLYLYHFDFYRFHDPDEWLDAGLREYFNDESVCLVEWPEKIGEQLPPPDVRIGLAVAGSGREVTLSAATQRGKSCLERLA